MISLVCGNLQYGTNNLTTNIKRLMDIENRLVAKGEGERVGWIGIWGLADDIKFRLLHLE